ncbi:MAG: hemerythrin domain-containing protein [Gammaproteobacteria bacterium]|jgi:hemerythrin-like domain-containing protein
MMLWPNSPEAGFDDPLAMLAACHERIARHCDTLERLAAHIEQMGIDEDARVAAAQVLKYFSTAAPDHHADEEQDLFPRLRSHPEWRQEEEDMLLRLATEHREQDAAWISLRPGLEDIAQGRLPPQPLPVARFVELQRSHLEFENRHLLPLARRVLNVQDLRDMGHAMRARRGLG